MDDILEKIYKSGLKLLVPSTPEMIYSIIVKEAIKLVGADIGTIHLELGGIFMPVYSTVPSFYGIKPRKRGNTYKTFINRKPRIVETSKLQKIHPAMRGVNVNSSILIPLSYQNKAIGVLSVDSKKEQKFSERELEILVLFGSLASLAIRKTQLYDETKKALDSRDLFISMAAHEFRTPLTTIQGYVQLLWSKMKNSNSSEFRWVEQLKWETSRLIQLVNELLVVDRIKEGNLQYLWKECHLGEIIARAENNFKFVHSNHKIRINNQLSNKADIVIGDFDKLLQTIDNLLDNATKFSPAHSIIELNLKHRSPYFTLEIKDSGKGIDKKDLPKIFENYYRGIGHKREGMGLGLYLAKNIIEKHHGEIRVKSKSQRGTSVIVKLPEARI
ncbi:GAF domain-containing protein [Candidatus Daviesbacteria bacterium]|nr:GAF domain-containing protein [Candidatus Daviesbacteria bacterium]